MTNLAFTKMHGLGNDFVVLDARDHPLAMTDDLVARLADRKRGIGCDQLIIIENTTEELADAFMHIRNADGSEAEACGNATRCVAALLMAEKSSDSTVIETVAGLLDVEAAANGNIKVDMGAAKLDWRDIPLSEAADTLHLNISAGPLSDGVGVNMGNPHGVFFVDNIDNIALELVGPQLEQHAIFPEFANISVAHVINENEIRLRVWERGVGITQACGTAACATLVAAARRNLTGRKADIILDGGRLHIEWLPDDHVLMTGPVATSFAGTIDPSLLA